MKSVQPGYGYGMTFSACLWLGLFPLLQKGTYSHITYDKWIGMMILLVISLACFLFDLGCKLFVRNKQPEVMETGRYGIRRMLPLILASALTLWTVLSCLVSRSGPDIWWRAETARYEGLASQLCYFILFVLFFFSCVRLKPVLLSAAAGLTVFLVIVLLQRAGGNPLGLYPSGRSYDLNPEFQGTIGNIDMCTGWLLLLSGLFLRSFIGTAGKLKQNGFPPRSLAFSSVCLAGFFMSAYLIITMEVQFGMISLGVLCLALLLRFLPAKMRLPLLILLIVLMLLIVWFWPGQGGGIWELHEILHGRARLSFGSNRVAVWVYSLRMAREDLLLGGGSGTFPSRFSRFLSDNSLEIPREQDGLILPDYFDNPHNEYIAQLADHGLPAMLLFMSLLLLAVFRGKQYPSLLRSSCSVAVLCYTVQAFFSFSVCLVAPMFWVTLGLSFSDPGFSPAQQNPL